MIAFLGMLIHPFRSTRLFYRACLGKPLPAKYVRKLEKKAAKRGMTLDELWDTVDGSGDWDGVRTAGEERATRLEWDEEYEAYDGTLDID
jgi:hypothetical protein